MAEQTNSPDAAHKAAIAAAATTKIWRHVSQSSPTAAVDFVNANPPQGPGEVSMSGKADGSVDVYYYL